MRSNEPRIRIKKPIPLQEIIVKKLTSLAAALLAVSLSYSANAAACEELSPQLFQDFDAAVLDLQAKGIAANLAAVPYATPAFNTTAFNESAAAQLVSVWTNANTDGSLTTVQITNYASMAPWIAAQFGAELSSYIGYVRYWADIHRWYNRATSPFTNAIVPAQTAHDAANSVHAKAQKINRLASECLKTMVW
jgi:hypothetical protein